MSNRKIFQIKFALLFAFVISASVIASKAQKKPMATELKLNPKETIVKAYKLVRKKESWIMSKIDNETLQPQTIMRAYSQDYQVELFHSTGKKVLEMILLGDYKYFNFGEKWEKSKRKEEDNSDEIREFFFAKPPETINNAQFIGEEQLDGINTFVYQFDFDFDLAIKKSSSKFRKLNTRFSTIKCKVKIWINNENLPVKIESNREYNSPKGIKTENEVEKFKYNEVVKIEAPEI